jgi:hypothetical protein
VGDNWKFDWGKEIRTETPSFVFIPCECSFVISDKVMHEVAFCGPKEIAWMVLVDDHLSFETIARGR